MDLERPLGKRHRNDSIIQTVNDEFQDFKRMKTGDAKWAKVDKMIGKSAS